MMEQARSHFAPYYFARGNIHYATIVTWENWFKKVQPAEMQTALKACHGGSKTQRHGSAVASELQHHFSLTDQSNSQPH